jgi:diadenosine tetraphosphate (Ap4A) HIT family hydrolase
MECGRWSEDWVRRRGGTDCPFCAEARPDENAYGARVAAGAYSDAYLQRRATLPGYTIVVWRGRHLLDFTDLSDDEARGYWSDVVRVARALVREFRPLHLNHTTLGNMIPHLHTNVVLRYMEDPAPEADLPLSGGVEMPEAEFHRHVDALRAALRSRVPQSS